MTWTHPVSALSNHKHHQKLVARDREFSRREHGHWIRGAAGGRVGPRSPMSVPCLSRHVIPIKQPHTSEH